MGQSTGNSTFGFQVFVEFGYDFFLYVYFSVEVFGEGVIMGTDGRGLASP